MNLSLATQIMTFGVVIADALIAAAVLFQNPRRPAHRAFFTFVFGAAVWGSGIILLFATKQFIFDRIIFYGGTVMLFGLFSFSYIFPNDQPLTKRFWIAASPLLLVLLLVPFGFFVEGMTVGDDGSIQPILGQGFPAFILTSAVYLLTSLALFIRRFRMSSGVMRLQMEYLLVGAALFAAGILLFTILLPAFGLPGLNLFGPMTSIFFVGLTAYSIIRYQFLDIRRIIQRGIIYGVFAALVFLIDFFITLLLSSLVAEHITALAPISGALAATLVVLNYQPLDRLLRRSTDQVFYKRSYDAQEVLRRVGKTLNTTLDSQSALIRVRAILGDALKASTLDFLVLEEGRFQKLVGEAPPLDEKREIAFELSSLLQTCPALFQKAISFDECIYLLRIPAQRERFSHQELQTLERLGHVFREFRMELLIPVFTKGVLSGMMVFGMKRSGDRFTTQDRELLSDAAHHIGIATENFRLYEAQQRYAESLEQQVAERTKELRHLYEVQTQLIQGISHALQTPLTVMRAEFDSVGRRVPALRKKVATAERSIDEASRLVSDLLDLVRLEARSDVFKEREVDFSQLLQNTVEYFTIVAKNQKVKVVSFIDTGVTLRGDANRLEELVANILSNAIKYMASVKKKQIDITLEKKGREAVLRICDTGSGIDARDLPHVFQPFYRSTHSLAAGIEGQGLGLAICKRIVERHDGTIRVESTLGKGTTFTVTLPVASR